MKRKLKISASFQGVIPTGQFQNSRPGFFAEEEFELESDTTEANKIIQERQKELQEICYDSFEKEAEKARVLKVKNDLKSFRFIFDPVLNQEVPSVTSIQNYEKEFFVSEADLKLYAAQGCLVDAEFRNYAKTGYFAPNSALLECVADRFILKSQKLSNGKYLSLNGWDIEEFVKKFKITDMVSFENPVFNRKHRYGGTPDIGCKMDGVKTLLSVKRTYVATENFVQDSAYAKCDGMEEYEQIAVAEFKPEADGGNKCGYSAPRVTKDIDSYFEIFLRRRSDVIKIFGV